MFSRLIKRVSIVASFISLVLFSLSFVEVVEDHSFYGYFYDNYIHFNRRKVDVEKIKGMNLDKFQLILNDTIISEIRNEYKELIPRKDHERIWEKYDSKLIFNNKDTFDVVIKGHGVTPVSHINLKGKFSIRVKLKNGKKIYNYNRFSFVVLERTLNRNITLSYFSDLMNIYCKPSKLVILKLNNDEFYPYNLEPSNKVYTLNENLFYSKINKNKKSPISFFCGEKTLFVKEFNQSDANLFDYIKVEIGNAKKDTLIGFHKEYFSKYLSVLFVLNFNGHGISNESIFIAHHNEYGWIPILHRDNVPVKITNDSSRNILVHFKDQIVDIAELYGEEYFISQLLLDESFVKSLKKNIEIIVHNKMHLFNEIDSNNKIYEKLLGGGFLDVHFDWRDETKLPLAYQSSFLELSLIKNNFSFWGKKLKDESFWLINTTSDSNQ